MPKPINEIDQITDDLNDQIKNVCFRILTIPIEDNNPLKQWDILFPNEQLSEAAAHCLAGQLKNMLDCMNNIADIFEVLISRVEGSTTGYRVMQEELGSILSRCSWASIDRLPSQALGPCATYIMKSQLKLMIGHALTTGDTLHRLVPIFQIERLNRLVTAVLTSTLRSQEPAKVAQHISNNLVTDHIAQTVLINQLNQLGGAAFLKDNPLLANIPGVKELSERIIDVKHTQAASQWTVQSTRSRGSHYPFHSSKPQESSESEVLHPTPPRKPK